MLVTTCRSLGSVMKAACSATAASSFDAKFTDFGTPEPGQIRERLASGGVVHARGNKRENSTVFDAMINARAVNIDGSHCELAHILGAYRR